MKVPFPLIAASLFFILLFTGCPDYDCLFELPENKNELIVQEIILNTNFENPEILRTYSFKGGGVNVPYNFEFYRMEYAFDGVTSYFTIGDKGFMTYGNDKSAFEQPVDITHPPFLKQNTSPMRGEFDYQASTNESIYHKTKYYLVENPFTKDSVDLPQHRLNRYDHTLMSGENLLEYNPVFIDSVTVDLTRIYDQRFTPDGQILMIGTSTLSEINSSEGSEYVHLDEFYNQMYLFELKEDLTLDTLFTFPQQDENESYYRGIKLSGSNIFMVFNGNTYEFNQNSRQVNFLYKGTLPHNISADEQSLTFNYGEKYFNFTKNEVVDLSEYFSDIIFSVPHKNLVAIQNRPDTDKIYIFDTRVKSVVRTISYDELPAFSEVSGIKKYRLENPVFTKDGNLIFMQIRTTFLDDEDYISECE